MKSFPVQKFRDHCPTHTFLREVNQLIVLVSSKKWFGVDYNCTKPWPKDRKAWLLPSRSTWLLGSGRQSYRQWPRCPEGVYGGTWGSWRVTERMNGCMAGTSNYGLGSWKISKKFSQEEIPLESHWVSVHWRWGCACAGPTAHFAEKKQELQKDNEDEIGFIDPHSLLFSCPS